MGQSPIPPHYTIIMGARAKKSAYDTHSLCEHALSGELTSGFAGGADSFCRSAIRARKGKGSGKHGAKPHTPHYIIIMGACAEKARAARTACVRRPLTNRLPAARAGLAVSAFLSFGCEKRRGRR